MRAVYIAISLLLGIVQDGVVTKEVYQGYEKHNDIYLVEIQGISIPIIADDLCIGDEVTIEGYHVTYRR